MGMISGESQRAQLAEQRRKVDFDTYDVTVDELIRRVSLGRIDVAPVYQRQFRWAPPRQSRLIESVLLGIPVPPLFMATNSASEVKNSWEVVDGLQRLLTLVNFLGDEKTRLKVGLKQPRLGLCELMKLTTFNGCTESELGEDLRSVLEDRPFKVIVLNDKSDLQVRFDLFERLNTGGISLTDQEIRACVFRGEFMDMLGNLAALQDFKTVVVLPEAKDRDGTREEFVLRFFAFYDRFRTFDHSVKDFLQDFTRDTHEDPNVADRSALFGKTFEFLAACFPTGIKSKKGQTPVNLYEGVAVGAALALSENPQLAPSKNVDWLKSKTLQYFTTGATNSRPRVVGRIEYCRDAFLGHDVEL
jgi:hypothetical protein